MTGIFETGSYNRKDGIEQEHQDCEKEGDIITKLVTKVLDRNAGIPYIAILSCAVIYDRDVD